MSFVEDDSETVNVEDILGNFFLKKYDIKGSDRSERDSKYKKKSKHKKHKSDRRSGSSEGRNSNIINVADILANFFLKKFDLKDSDFLESDSKYKQKSKHKKHKSGRRSESRNSNRISVEDILANFFLEKFGMEGLDRSESDSKHKKKSKHKCGRSDSSERSSNSMSRRSRTRSHQRRRRSRSWSFSEDTKSRHSARWRSRSTSREHQSSSSESCKIDKAKIREIAEKNLLIMIQQGTLPRCIKELLEYFKEKELVSISAGVKSVQEITDFCLKLSNKENEETDYVKDAGNVKEENYFIHHPFKLKEQSVIKFDLKSAFQIPIKTRAEKFPKPSSQFPVSSGNQHKKKELEWVPVVHEQSKSDLKQNEVKSVVPVESVATPQTADQFTHAAPITEGKGMSLLKKMGWNPGEGLGKNKEGSLVPLLIDIKMDKKGLISEGENGKNNIANGVKKQQGKHPVCALMEFCSRRKWKSPVYTVIKDTGPPHKKFFLFKVEVNGVDYQPALPSPNKKDAKVNATIVCLKALKVFPT